VEAAAVAAAGAAKSGDAAAATPGAEAGAGLDSLLL
jgi:hypothetical protein